MGLFSNLLARVAPRRQKRSYAAAQLTRLTEGWSTVNHAANVDLHRSLDALRARSRQLCRDNEYARKFLNLAATNIVGPAGFTLQARVYEKPGVPDASANDAIEAAFARFCRKGVCDVSGLHSLRGVEDLLIKTAARDGEYLVRKVYGRAARNEFGFALQVLDIDRLDTQLNRPQENGQTAIRMGVEIDSFGRPTNYWLKESHPGDLYGGPSTRHLVVPADEILHGYISERPEQLRGVPWMHAAMLGLNNIKGYQEAAVIAARVGASKMGFFTTPTGEAFPAATGVEGTPGTASEQLMMDADPGVFQSLPEGVQFTPFNPDYPSAMFESFMKTNLRGIASGLGVAYHALANDLEGVNFSSIRSGTLEERDQWQMLQQWFVEHFLTPVYQEWLKSAISFGAITLANGSALPIRKLDKFSAHLWQPRRWEWVDPLKDIEADKAAIDANLKAPQDIAAKMGMDYEDVLQKIKQARDLAAKFGIDATPTAKKVETEKP
jgi:lambda family phage portal protein